LISNAQKHFKSNYVLAPSSTFGKNVLPRVAASLDVAQISDIISVKGADTFVRPIYAGNALATVKSNDPVKVITVRTTAFEKAKESGSESEIVAAPNELNGESKVVPEWLKDEVKESARPDLQAARVVVSGGRGDLNILTYNLHS
jgi:electron transfer flavoprotein alpha subunit